MTFQGPVAQPVIPLLVRHKKYAIETAQSIVKDVDLDECSKHRTWGFGRLWSLWHDEGKFWYLSIYLLFPLKYVLSLSSSLFIFKALVRMRAFQIRCATQEALVKRLKTCLETNGDRIKGYKEAIRLLNAEVNTLKAKVSQLEERARWVKELTKENSNLMTELETLCEHVAKAKTKVLAEFQVS